MLNRLYTVRVDTTPSALYEWWTPWSGCQERTVQGCRCWLCQAMLQGSSRSLSVVLAAGCLSGFDMVRGRLLQAPLCTSPSLHACLPAQPCKQKLQASAKKQLIFKKTKQNWELITGHIQAQHMSFALGHSLNMPWVQRPVSSHISTKLTFHTL